MDRPDWLPQDALLIALVLFTGIAGTGVVRRLLGEMGYNGIGRIVFVLGYGSMVFVLWFVWLRPLELTGPVEE